MKATEIRRQKLYEFQADQELLRARQEELEEALSLPAEDWPEAAAKAQYLIQLYSATADAQDPHRRAVIAQTLDDLARLCERSKGQP